MQTTVYKPYKKKPETWKEDESKRRTSEDGRTECCVEIGVQQIVEEDTGEIVRTEHVSEYIYKDIKDKILAAPSDFDVRINMGFKPQLAVLYCNRFVVYNDQVQREARRIKQFMEDLKTERYIGAAINSVLNIQGRARQSEELKDFIGQVNENLNAIYPAEFVGAILREHVFETARKFSEEEEELHFASYEYLVKEAGQEYAKSLRNGSDTKRLSMIKEELLFGFLIGDYLPRHDK